MYHLESFWHQSQVLEGNPLSDPTRRQTFVLTPDGYGDSQPLPAIWMLASFLNTGASFLSFRPWQENLWDRVNRLDAEGTLLPVRFVLPDVFTSLGGSQFLDSPAIGPYQTYLFDELLAVFESRYATSRRGLAGTSSGGYGALVSALLGPSRFSGVAAHAADMGFDWCYLPDFPRLFDLMRRYQGLSSFWKAFGEASPKPNDWIPAINVLAMAAAYSPNLSALPPHVDLPLDPSTLALDVDCWHRWRKWDPTIFIDRAEVQERARELSLLYFDAGASDQYNLQYGAQLLSQKLSHYGIDHHFELFEGGHFGTQSRFDLSLPRLAKALTD